DLLGVVVIVGDGDTAFVDGDNSAVALDRDGLVAALALVDPGRRAVVDHDHSRSVPLGGPVVGPDQGDGRPGRHEPEEEAFHRNPILVGSSRRANHRVTSRGYSPRTGDDSGCLSTNWRRMADDQGLMADR